MMWPFKKKEAVETRSSGSGYTAEIMSARESYIAGRSGLAELTATVQGAVTLWESAFALADVQGTTLLDRRNMAIAARSLALRGEALFLIRERGLVPVSDWELRTRDGRPTAYRVSVSEAGGGRTETALAAEVLHVCAAADAVTPWIGQAPLRRAQLTAGLLNALESALGEVYETAPLGSSIVPMPEMPEQDMERMARGFRGNRGRVLIRESVNVSAAGGAAPVQDWKPHDLSPDLSRAMTRETLDGARGAILMAFGVLPGLASPNTTGPMVREAQRHLATWVLQPLAMLLAEEATNKLGVPVMIDTLRPLQAFDAGGRARALGAVVQTLALAKEAGIDMDKLNEAMSMVNWGDGDRAA